MLSQAKAQIPQVQVWHIDRLVFYARNPRKNDAAVDRMCGSIREFGFKIPVLARSDGEVVAGHLRLKAARKLGSWPGGDISGIPVILCDEWTAAQVKAFRLMVNRSVTWASWDDDLLTLELAYVWHYRTTARSSFSQTSTVRAGTNTRLFDHPTQKPVELMRRPILNTHQARRRSV
jgi:hypothetical protein